MLRPLHNRVMIKMEPLATESSGGIAMLSAEVPTKGEVVGVGPGIYQDGKLVPPAVEVGDVVMYVQDGGDVITVDGDEFRIMTDDHVIGVFS